MKTPPPPQRPRWKRIALNALKSGLVGVALGGLCAFLPEHLEAARFVCRIAVLFLGGS